MESTKKVFHVLYDDDGTLMAAAQKLVAQGIRVKDVYSPFPVHGIDPVIGIKRTRLAIASFMYAMTGTSLALLGMPPPKIAKRSSSRSSCGVEPRTLRA